MQRVHEKGKERIDVRGGLKTKTPADRIAVDRVLDVGVECVTETEDMLTVGAAPPAVEIAAGAGRQDRVHRVAGMTNAGGDTVAGQRVRHRRRFADHQPVSAADLGGDVWLERCALDIERGVRGEKIAKSRMTRQFLTEHRLQRAACAAAGAHRVSRHTKPTLVCVGEMGMSHTQLR